MDAKQNDRLHYVVVAVIVFLLILLSVIVYKNELVKMEKQASFILQSFKEILTLNLKNNFNHTNELTVVLTENDGTTHFQNIAERIVKNTSCIYVEILEGVTLTRVYPNDSERQKAVGSDITELDYAYTLARLTKELVVEGPIMQDNREVFLIIQPIFKKGSKDEDIFVGEVVVALDGSYVMESLHLDTLTQNGYEYELWRVHPLDGSKKRIAISSENVDFSRAVETKIQFPTVWTLSIIPTEGWYNREIVLVLLLGSSVVLICVVLFLYFYRGKRKLEQVALLAQRYDKETGFLNIRNFAEELDNWIASSEKPFVLIYVVFENYNYISQLCQPEQKCELIDHIVDSLKNGVKSNHMITRIGECNFVLAIKDKPSFNELENMQKSLIIDLIWKFDYREKKIFLIAECTSCQFPEDGLTAQDLLQKVVQNFYDDEKKIH